MTSTPAPTPGPLPQDEDDLLPGLRAVQRKMYALHLRARSEYEEDWADLEVWVYAEIARLTARNQEVPT